VEHNRSISDPLHYHRLALLRSGYTVESCMLEMPTRLVIFDQDDWHQ